MKSIPLFLLAFNLAWAQGSIFDFQDREGYEKCLRQNALVETAKGDSVDEHRRVDHFEIQTRCIQHAVKMLSAKKDAHELLEYIKSTKQSSSTINAIDFVQLLVNASRPACNDMDVYTVMKQCLAGPKDKGPSSYFEKARKAIRVCLKDAEFRKDFIDEKDSDDTYVSANACEILLDEKIVKSCKKGQAQ